MNLPLQRFGEAARRGNDRPIFRVVMIYEDALAGRHAGEFCGRLMDQLGGNCRLNDNLWNFSVLGIHEIRNLAVSAAAAADIVIFSASGRKELPAETKDWLDLWAWLMEGGKGALFALFEDQNAAEVAPIRTYLGGIAQRKHLDFFPHTTFSLRASPLTPQHKTGAGFSDAEEWEPGENGTVEMELTDAKFAALAEGVTA